MLLRIIPLFILLSSSLFAQEAESYVYKNELKELKRDRKRGGIVFDRYAGNGVKRLRLDIENARNALKALEMKVYSLDNKLLYQETDERKRLEKEQKLAEEKMNATVTAYEKRYEELQKQKV